ETITALNSSHMNDAAHPKLESSTIGIKIIPRPEPGKCPSVHVKLEESAIKR
ncbi:hypothetical protein MKW94_029761, partial [Papaver nudicaule]|nr:hypothetical protein [Papaver nudicaule]